MTLAAIRSPAGRNVVVLLAIAVLVVGVYWPGLYGGYIFDDFSFIVENTGIHISGHSIGDWVRAAFAFPGSHQGRWLTMLTFAANYVLTGLDPFWFKLTNLCIHLVNGLLLFAAIRALVDLWNTRADASSIAVDRDLVAFVITACWLLLPINVTGVLYVSQRLEALSNTFVFLGLALYLRARVHVAIEGEGLTRAFASLLACTLVGFTAKESALLLPAYTFCVEWVIGGFRDPRIGRALRIIYGAMLLLPIVVGIVWLTTWVGTSDAPARPFTTGERLLTESRVLLRYIVWVLVPNTNALGLYHDEMTLSRSLLDPPSTLVSFAALAGLFALAAWQRRRRPLFTLGILWFFAGHALTATVIPLELVYEHRNYFPSVGLLLAVASLVYLERPPTMRPMIVAILACLALAFYSGLTALRARDWGNPITLALSEAARRPLSPNAQYELGRALTIAAQNPPDETLAAPAQQAFEAGSNAPGMNILCEQGLIVLAARRHQPIQPIWWSSLTRKLAAQSPSEGNISALANLVECQENGGCQLQLTELGAAFHAAMSHPAPNARLLSAYADFAALAHDDKFAEELMRLAIERKPDDPAYRTDLIEFLSERGRIDEAKRELDALEPLNHFGSLDEVIAAYRSRIASPPSRVPSVGRDSLATPTPPANSTTGHR